MANEFDSGTNVFFVEYCKTLHSLLKSQGSKRQYHLTFEMAELLTNMCG